MDDYEKEPAKYFFQTKLYRDADQIREFENSLLYVADDIRKSRARKFFVQNTSQCTKMGTCKFLPICSGTIPKKDVELFYTVREDLHPELIAE
jgi:hypothetical protein